MNIKLLKSKKKIFFEYLFLISSSKFLSRKIFNSFGFLWIFSNWKTSERKLSNFIKFVNFGNHFDCLKWTFTNPPRLARIDFPHVKTVVIKFSDYLFKKITSKELDGKSFIKYVWRKGYKNTFLCFNIKNKSVWKINVCKGETQTWH